MHDDLKIRREDLVNNPTARIAVCLCLDTSGSMAGAAIEELNEGVKLFLRTIQEDEVARYAAEVAVVTFGQTAQRKLDFGALGRESVSHFDADGATPLGAGVNLALDLLDARKKEYSQAGIDYYQPWLVLMTDGAPTDAVDLAASRTVELTRSKKLALFPIGVGPDADLSTLTKFSPNRSPLLLRGLDFKAFFEWLSKSVSRVSQSIPGDAVPLDTKGINGWAAI